MLSLEQQVNPYDPCLPSSSRPKVSLCPSSVLSPLENKRLRRGKAHGRAAASSSPKTSVDVNQTSIAQRESHAWSLPATNSRAESEHLGNHSQLIAGRLLPVGSAAEGAAGESAEEPAATRSLPMSSREQSNAWDNSEQREVDEEKATGPCQDRKGEFSRSARDFCDGIHERSLDCCNLS